MQRSRLALSGLFALAVSLSYLAYIYKLGVEADAISEGDALASSYPCDDPLGKVELERNVLSLSDTEALLVHLENDGGWLRDAKRDKEQMREFMEEQEYLNYERGLEDSDGSCDAQVELYAPAFVITPAEASRTVEVPVLPKTASVGWVLTPTKVGTHKIVVQAGNTIATIGISITNNLGLPLWVTKYLSVIIAFFGPALTFPWLYDRIKAFWEKKKTASKVILP